MHQNKSLFIDQQIPGFIREEYPLFSEFIKQYYSFLEQEAGKIIAVNVLEGGSNYNPISLWTANTTFQKNSRVAYAGNVYLITSTSVSNTTPPTHTSGTVSFYTYISVGSPTSVSVSFKVKDPTTQEFINDPRIGSDAATATALIISGSVDKILVTNFGSNYTEEDNVQVVISGGGGSGAILEAITTTKLGNINSAVAQTINSRDIDEAIPEFVDLLRKEFIPKLPQKLFRDNNATDYNEVDVQKFVKFIKQFYKSKGAEKSIQFLFRILFNSDVSIYYPKTDMLRVSDGKWTIDKVIRIRPEDSNIAIEAFRELYLGERIIGSTSGATAIIQDIDNVAISGGGSVIELKLSDINGTFNLTGENILLFKLDNSMDVVIGSVKQCIQKLSIEDGGFGYQVGDQIITSNSFLAKVKSVGSLGVILDYTIDNFGFDYGTEPYDTDFTTTGGSGAIFKGNLGVVLTYPGYYLGTDGQPSSQKKIQDSEYYQDFSYEIISDQSANVFGQLLNTTIHPAGLKLFSKILSIREESLYLDRLNFNPTNDRYTFVVGNDDTARTDFDVNSILNNGTIFLSGLSVAVGLILFTRSSGIDYLFEVSTAGILGSTLPTITEGIQVSGTASLRFIGVAERPLGVYLNGELKVLNVDFILYDANTIRFLYVVNPGSVVRVLVRRDILFVTDYNEYVKAYTKIDIRKLTTLREPFFIYSWYSGLPSTPITWTRTTEYFVNDILEHLGNYYIVVNSGFSGKKPPSFSSGSYSNGSLILKYFNVHIGYVGDIIYSGTNFYKITGTTNANISGIFGQVAPTHTSGTVLNGKLLLTYYNPGFIFWESGRSVLVGDIIFYNGNFYKVVTAGNLGSTPPTHKNGSYPNGTAVLEYYTYNYAAQTSIVYVSQLDPGKAMLGPTVNDIERNAFGEIPQFFQDIPGTQAVTSGSTFTQLVINEPGLSIQDDEYIHYSIIITYSNGSSAGSKIVRTITNYNGLTKTFTFGSSITIPGDCTSIQYRLLQNFIIGSYNGTTKKIGLSSYDPAYNLNTLLKTVFSVVTSSAISTVTDTIYIENHGFTDKVKLTYDANGQTAIGGLTDSLNYYTKVVDKDNIRLCLRTTDVETNSYLDISSVGTGTQFFYLQNTLYQHYNLIITSGGGINSVLNIVEYNEIDNTITYENTPTGTIVPGESTYIIYPDLYNGEFDGSGSNEDFYSSSVLSLIISSGGKNYEVTDTITFLGGYGTAASASITSVDGSGRITSVNLNNMGYGYIYSPIVQINTVNGSGASIYPIISPTASVGIDSYYKYSMNGNYIYSLDNSYIPSTKFEYGETVQQGLNKARVIKYDSYLKKLYLESDEESDQLLLNLDLIRVKDGSTIDINVGEILYSGWKSTNIPVGSITKTYKKSSSLLFLGSFINEFGEITYMTTYSNLSTSVVTVDTNSQATYRSVKYMIQASYSTFYQFSEIVLIHNGTTVDIVEHSLTHTSASPLVTFSADLNGGNIRLMAVAASGSTTNLVIYKCPIVV